MTLDDFIALSDEIAALARSGVPLDRGLSALGEEMPGRLGLSAAMLAERTARGQPLDEAVMDPAVGLPPAYRAVIRAGVRAGRLPAAMEAIASSARRMAESSRAAVVAVGYPLLVVAVAWWMAAMFCQVLAPHLAESFQKLDVPGVAFFNGLTELGHWAWLWGVAGPVALALLFLLWWTACRRAAMMHVGWSDRMLLGLPWMGSMLRSSRAATFLEILALLIENQTPLDEALSLAAAAAGDRRILHFAGQMAAMHEGGKVQMGTVPFAASPFPMMTWMMLSARRDGSLMPAIKRTAAAYHRRARRQADMLRTMMPVALLVSVGGSAAAAYALALFWPYTAMLHALAMPG